jgi:metal-dependent hydrolase (beta-lactamase superfamily II)
VVSFPRIESIIEEVLRLGVKKVGPSHCTGDEAKEILKGQYGYH